MARCSDFDTSGVYDTATKWRTEVLANGTSLLWPGERVWIPETLTKFKTCFVDRPDATSDSFEAKFQRQLADQPPEVTRLACELLVLHFLFTTSVGGERKRGLIKTVAGWKELVVDEGLPAMKALQRGIGGPGQAYNTRRPFEIAYTAKVALRLVQTDQPERAGILSDHHRFRELLDEVAEDGTFASRHILLHLLFPEHYERIASGGHKQQIVEAFEDMAGGAGGKLEDLDDRLLAIRRALEEQLSGKTLDFYWEPLRGCWNEAGEASEDGEISPLQALGVKRQIVLYGPPGTGKTYDAKVLAETLIRQGILREWKPRRYFTEEQLVKDLVENRVRRVQLHPGYGYEDLVRGLFLVDEGKTEYREGVLLRIIDEIARQPAEYQNVPFVLILDEMNRADLSKVLGECFSLLEDRDVGVQLAGQDESPRQVRMPANLYFIGTMNLIDQSLEQVDFALRRRFLWFLKAFSRDSFLAVAEYRWQKLHAEKRMPRPWDRFREEFDLLANRAVALNGLIEKHPSLGTHYQIGHTYFCDVVALAQKNLSAKPSCQRLLFNKRGEALGPVTSLWNYSLRPLLEQYLSGVDGAERKRFLRQAESELTQSAS